MPQLLIASLVVQDFETNFENRCTKNHWDAIGLMKIVERLEPTWRSFRGKFGLIKSENP